MDDRPPEKRPATERRATTKAKRLRDRPEPDVDTENIPASSYRWVILGFGILGYAATLFARQNYSGIQKFIAADLHLDKALLGLLGSVFFYSYALFQMPWGVASDKWGSRSNTGIGVLLVAGTMVGFATSQSAAQLLFWRAASGIAGAAVYVAMSGGVARWFPQHERGLSQTALGGVGGALGESAAFFLLPAMAISWIS
jgi:sugar phosphate permease